jgi:pyruvate/oxaloacetate carboxyltransferase
MPWVDWTFINSDITNYSLKIAYGKSPCSIRLAMAKDIRRSFCEDMQRLADQLEASAAKLAPFEEMAIRSVHN